MISAAAVVLAQTPLRRVHLYKGALLAGFYISSFYHKPFIHKRLKSPLAILSKIEIRSARDSRPGINNRY